jgi:hypothetical protein
VRRTLATTLLFAALAAPGLAAAQAGSDDAALGDLERMLADPAARNENAASDPHAAAVEDLLGGYPPYAQQELGAIAMMIVRESGEDASQHVDAYQRGGPEAAARSFSPAVRARVAALEQRLAQDPSFNSPANLQRMHGQIPDFLGQPAR